MDSLLQRKSLEDDAY